MTIKKFSRKVDGKGFREFICDLAGDDCTKVYYLDGYDDAIIGFADTDFDCVPHIVYDYDLMLKVAFNRERQEEYNKDSTDEEVMNDALSSVDDASYSIQSRNGLPKGAKEPIIIESIKEEFIDNE